MGYRSDVSLVITRKLFAKMLQEIPEETKELIRYTERFESKGDSLLLYWNHIKWYEDSYPVGRFQQFLETAEDNDSDDNAGNKFHLLRMGENWDDNVEMGSYWDNPFSAHFCRSIEIDVSGTEVSLEAFT